MGTLAPYVYLLDVETCAVAENMAQQTRPILPLYCLNRNGKSRTEDGRASRVAELKNPSLSFGVLGLKGLEGLRGFQRASSEA